MSIADQIFAAGIVGCGGAGFPTHLKLGAKNLRHLVLNGAECEPLLGTDRWLMRNRADDIVAAAAAVACELGAGDCTIGLKRTYTREIAALTQAIEKAKAPITIHQMDSFYPAGDEQVLVYEVTGEAVPPAGIPLDVGTVVSNIATMVAIYDAMNGIPFTYKYLTVNGAVPNPVVLHLPVGTSVAQCLSQAGGPLPERYVVISGGPMMGNILTMEQAAEAVVTKTTSGLLVLPEDSALGNANKVSLLHMKNRAASACIQCSYCTQLCPRNLLGHPLEPHKIMRKMAIGNDVTQLLDDPDIRSASLCCQCGVCELYACPMGLQPRRVNGILKDALAKAAIRYPKGEGAREVPAERKLRRIPTKRAASRAGVLQYMGNTLDQLLECQPEEVKLMLNQQIGTPGQPVVGIGDHVTAGQLVAKCPDGKMGANLHASITGKVTALGDSVTIRKE